MSIIAAFIQVRKMGFSNKNSNGASVLTPASLNAWLIFSLEGSVMCAGLMSVMGWERGRGNKAGRVNSKLDLELDFFTIHVPS